MRMRQWDTEGNKNAYKTLIERHHLEYLYINGRVISIMTQGTKMSTGLFCLRVDTSGGVL
jgi:hypothetical protein